MLWPVPKHLVTVSPICYHFHYMQKDKLMDTFSLCLVLLAWISFNTSGSNYHLSTSDDQLMIKGVNNRKQIIFKGRTWEQLICLVWQPVSRFCLGPDAWSYVSSSLWQKNTGITESYFLEMQLLLIFMIAWELPTTVGILLWAPSIQSCPLPAWVWVVYLGH